MNFEFKRFVYEGLVQSAIEQEREAFRAWTRALEKRREAQEKLIAYDAQTTGDGNGQDENDVYHQDR